MSTHTTKTALKHIERAEFLATSIRTQQPTVTRELTRFYGDFTAGDGEGESLVANLPNWDHLQSLHVAALEASAGEVKRTDIAHRELLIEIRRLAQKRRELVQSLMQGHRDLRRSVAGVYGDEGPPVVGLDTPVARSMLAIREQVLETVDRMRNQELLALLPPPNRGQSAIDFEQLAASRVEEVKALESTLAEIKTLRKQADEALVLKRAVRRKHRNNYVNVARIQEGLYRLAGLDDLADRIRVTERKSRKKAGEEASPQGVGTNPDASSPEDGSPDSPDAGSTAGDPAAAIGF